MVYSRYSEGDWDHSNKLHYSLSDRERSMGHNIRADAWRAVKVKGRKLCYYKASL